MRAMTRVLSNPSMQIRLEVYLPEVTEYYAVTTSQKVFDKLLTLLSIPLFGEV